MNAPRSFLTAGQAAKETKKAKSTITSAIKSGRLSASKGENGQYIIDPAELFRVFPPKKQNASNENDTGQIERDATPKPNTENTLKIKELELELKFERQESSRLQHQVNDMADERNHWRTQASQLALTHQPIKQQAEEEGATSQSIKKTSPIVWVLLGAISFCAVLAFALFVSDPQLFKSWF